MINPAFRRHLPVDHGTKLTSDPDPDIEMDLAILTKYLAASPRACYETGGLRWLNA